MSIDGPSDGEVKSVPADRAPRRNGRRRRLLAFALIVLAVAVTLLAWPRPRLVLYTSPGFTMDGRTVRVQALVPAGWKMGWSWVHFPPPDEAIISDQPIERYSWLPSIVRRILVRNDEFRSLIIFHKPPERQIYADGQIHSRMQRVPARLGGGIIYSATRELADKSGYSIDYGRTNRAEFEATYGQVCQSFKVIDFKE